MEILYIRSMVDLLLAPDLLSMTAPFYHEFALQSTDLIPAIKRQLSGNLPYVLHITEMGIACPENAEFMLWYDKSDQLSLLRVGHIRPGQAFLRLDAPYPPPLIPWSQRAAIDALPTDSERAEARQTLALDKVVNIDKEMRDRNELVRRAYQHLLRRLADDPTCRYFLSGTAKSSDVLSPTDQLASGTRTITDYPAITREDVQRSKSPDDAIRLWYQENTNDDRPRITWSEVAQLCGYSPDYLKGNAKSRFDGRYPEYQRAYQAAIQRRQRIRGRSSSHTHAPP